MTLEIGKLYSCEERFLMLYPDKDTVAHAEIAAAPITQPLDRAIERIAAHWTRRLGKPISYMEKSIPFLVLNVEENFYEVLGGDRKGWIIYRDWVKIKEIDYA
jgi:hypothetical protein